MIIFTIPVLGMFYASSSSDEGICDMLVIIFRYIISPKIYMYRMDTIQCWSK